MTNVVGLHDCADVPKALRAVADEIEAGDFENVEEATLILIGDRMTMFQQGHPANDKMNMHRAVMNLNKALYYIMRRLSGE